MELKTVQKYVYSLFDTLPLTELQSLSQINSELINQNVQYGRKIIQLSDKFTSKYRKDHFVDRKDVENKIIQIYKIVSPNSYQENLDQMVTIILKTLQQEKQKSNYNNSRVCNMQPISRSSYGQPLQNQTIKQSKLQYFRDDAEYLKLQQNTQKRVQVDKMVKSKLSSENNPHEEKRKKSVNKGKSGKKNNTEQFSTKNILQIKQIFEQQENVLRQIFEKVRKILQTNKINFVKENIKFTKNLKDSVHDNIIDIIKVNSENNKENILKIQNLFDLINDNSQKKLKHEGLAQGKFNLYLQQISRRQQVYSYAVSRLLQNVNKLRQTISIEHKKSQYLRIIENIYELGQKFYQLYPSHNVLKDLRIQKLSKEMQKLGLKNQGVQTTIGKSQKTIHKQMAQSKRNLLQLYKISTRVSENIDKFQKSIKFKKQIQLKQIEKFMHSLKDSFPKKNNIPSGIQEEVGSYHQELKKIMQQNQKNQKQLSDEFIKKNKKQDKKIQQLQRHLDEVVNQLKKQIEIKQNEKKKYQRKVEHEKQQNKKIEKQKNNLQKNLKQMSSQLKRLQQTIRNQQNQYDKIQKDSLEQNQKLINCLQENKGERQRIKNQLQQQKVRMKEQRQIYHEKIVMLQTKEQQQNEEVQKIKYQLHQMIQQNQTLKNQVQELTEIYEQKIKQLEDLIENIKQLQKQLKMHQIQNEELVQANKIKDQTINNMQSQIKVLQNRIKDLQNTTQQKTNQALKYRQIGLLNDSDINSLRQQMQKVKQAYIESEQQLEQAKIILQQLEIEKDSLLRQNKNLKRQIQDVDDRWQSNKLHRQKIQKQLSQYRDQLNIKVKQLNQVSHQADDYKRQLTKLKKQNLQLKEIITKADAQSRQLRQQVYKKIQQQTLDNGKRRLQLQGTKVELRKKTEQLQKQKCIFEEKIQTLQAKNKQMSQFITQKQLLARITNNHQSQ